MGRTIIPNTQIQFRRNMIKGTYIVYEDGKEIYRSRNVITKFGKRFLTNYIAGSIPNFSKDIAFGIDRKESLITAASASAGVITYTGLNYFSAGDKVSITGLSTQDFNISNATVAAANSTQFTVTSTITGTAVTGSTTGRAYKNAVDTDTRLGFEFYRSPVDIYSTDIQTNEETTTYGVVYKTTLPQEVSGIISELGIYPSTRISKNNFDSQFLDNFSDNLAWVANTLENPSYSEVGARIGDDVISLASGSGTAKTYTREIPTINLLGYSVNDSVTFAYYKSDNNLSKIRIKLHSDTANYFYADITPQSGIGYKIAPDISMATFFNNQIGSPDKANIDLISIEIHPTTGNTTSIGADGLRINDEDTFDPGFGLISRTALETPLVKYTGRTVDVEYRLELTF
jgi:hypothetical protein